MKRTNLLRTLAVICGIALAVLAIIFIPTQILLKAGMFCISVGVLLGIVYAIVVQVRKYREKKNNITETPEAEATNSEPDNTETADTEATNSEDATLDAAEATNSDEVADSTAAQAAAEAAAQAAAKAEAAQNNANKALAEIEKLSHERRLSENAGAIRAKESELALKRADLASKQQVLHFLRDDQVSLDVDVKQARVACLNAVSAKNNAFSKFTQSVKAKSEAEVAVANVTLDGGNEDALKATNEKLVVATKNSEDAFAELQRAINIANDAEKAENNAVAKADANKAAIAAEEEAVESLTSEINALEKELDALKA